VPTLRETRLAVLLSGSAAATRFQGVLFASDGVAFVGVVVRVLQRNVLGFVHRSRAGSEVNRWYIASRVGQ
jgi:hypothetical protein